RSRAPGTPARARRTRTLPCARPAPGAAPARTRGAVGAGRRGGAGGRGTLDDAGTAACRGARARARKGQGRRAQAMKAATRPRATPRRRRTRLRRYEIRELFSRLAELDPDPKTELEYSTPFELLVAVVLSAQATDVGVNKATRRLYPVANTPAKILALGEDGLKRHISSIGLFNTKAANVIA